MKKQCPMQSRCHAVVFVAGHVNDVAELHLQRMFRSKLTRKAVTRLRTDYPDTRRAEKSAAGGATKQGEFRR